MTFLEAVAWAEQLLEGAGVFSMIGGGAFALIRALVVWRKYNGNEAFRSFRENLGRAILLGLEFLVAADIIGTVAVEPTLENLYVLGLIVLIRTFLSFSLEVEIDGRWPWRKGSEKDRGPETI
jgi:uncharacterized membrane protein